MSIAPTLQRYLETESIQYDVVVHEPTMSSTRTAEACRISGNCLAKGIVLRRGSSDYVLAVLPASHHIHLADLRKTAVSTTAVLEKNQSGIRQSLTTRNIV